MKRNILINVLYSIYLYSFDSDDVLYNVASNNNTIIIYSYDDVTVSINVVLKNKDKFHINNKNDVIKINNNHIYSFVNDNIYNIFIMYDVFNICLYVYCNDKALTIRLVLLFYCFVL
jgi:hypothetical protein